MENKEGINTRAKISFGDVVLEFEGTESFVLSNLDKYKNLIVAASARIINPNSTSNSTKEKENKKNKAPIGATGLSSEKKSKHTKPAKISAERFDIHGNESTPSLQDFISEKKPNRANAEKIAVIGYYISEILEEEKFSEGQIEYAYKMMKYSRPNHLHQIMTNAKNDKDWYEPAEEGGVWTITRAGDIFVSDELPRDQNA